MHENFNTPCVVVDLDIAEANITRFQAYCDSHNLKLRPHIKTHKLPDLAQFQLKSGAVGITCQKISETEAMIANGGISDVLITYNIIGEAKTQRLRTLSERVNVSVVADSSAVVRGLGEAFADAEKPLAILVECNTGANRCGVSSPAAALELALEISQRSGLRFAGLMTYPPVGAAEEVQAWLGAAKELIEGHGMAVSIISSGGSPDMWQAHKVAVATEYRIGTYVYNDRSLVARGVCDWNDCALTVIATVVSVPSSNHAVIDAGSKVLTSDLLGLDGHGHVLGRVDLKIDQLSEEHGRLWSDDDIDLSVGDTVRIIPNHACVVANMLDHIELVRGNSRVGSTAVVARGQVW
ncbi:MAG: D-TA family PLP-dependent enzyme [Aestuariivita sp.]|nr:D-TA family PLP-dependent enzyme [Aestuariivita sp.]MCY4201026.1 D-TA family PLP-dependent enzyme [Aestuariivita sp.]MCY4287381.1 D-TA family PLP-dependent enzyme [Aestuariivita sp.]MCY4347853.1 D-TA family PLP-dependent enzyme [Aestuariivita sp.]